jgi:hypothetical protein
MARISFDRAAVMRLIAHANAASEHRSPWGERKPRGPQLLLVGDDGVYLMSSGLPAMPGAKGGTSNFVVYAKQCDPTKMSDDRCRDAKERYFGGDDGIEYLPVALFEQALATYPETGKELLMNLSPSGMGILSYTTAKPKKTKAAA